MKNYTRCTAYSVTVLISSLALFAGGQAALGHDLYTVPPNPFVSGWENREWIFQDIQINGQGNVGHVEPGQQVVLEFQWSARRTQAPTDCPGCLTQVYYGIAGLFDECIASYNTNATPKLDRRIRKTFTAPSEPGTYFLSQTYTTRYQCTPITMGNWPGFGVLIVGQEPWEVSKVINQTTQPIAINTPVLSGETYSNRHTPSGHAIAMPGKGFVSFTEEGHSTGCASPHWALQIDYQTVGGQQATWGYFYDSQGEIEVTLASDGTPSFKTPNGDQLIRGLDKPTCK